MKRLFRPVLVSFRRWILSTMKWPVSNYYRIFWKPRVGSLEETLCTLAKSQPDLTFIQVGANDGFQNDPLCKFVKAYNWKGLCFEPQPFAHKQLTQLYRKDRVTPINAAISNKPGQQDLYRISFTNQRWASGLSSFDKSHLENQINSGYVEAKCKKYGIIPPIDRHSWILAEPVRTVTFQQMLSQHDITALHLLHIDTEGFDYEIFKLFPFDQISPTAVLIETAHLSESDLGALRDSLMKMEYRLTQFGVDLYGQKG